MRVSIFGRSDIAVHWPKPNDCTPVSAFWTVAKPPSTSLIIEKTAWFASMSALSRFWFCSLVNARVEG